MVVFLLMVAFNQIEKVLITGASGFLGTLAREIFKDKQLTLISRSSIGIKKNEVWIKAEDLTDHEWWGMFNFDHKYDLILHFAEPVKNLLNKRSIDSVVQSHINFLSNASNLAAYAIYPLTAYCYDKTLSKRQFIYLQIKNRVSLSLRDDKNILLPIFHPLVDFGGGLSKLIALEKKIPFLNLFCSFNAQIPILKRKDLELFFVNLDHSNSNLLDIYSNTSHVSQLFYRKERFDLKFISVAFKFLCFLFFFLPQISLLVIGRKINKK